MPEPSSGERPTHVGGPAFDELEQLYESVPFGLAVLDRDLRFIRVNARMAEMNGLPVEAHIGRSLSEVAPDLAPGTTAGFRRVLETGQPKLGIEVGGYTAAESGFKRRWFENWMPLRDASGEVAAVGVVVWPVSGEAASAGALRQSSEMLHTIMDNIPVMLTFFRSGGVLFCNREFTRVTGYTKADAARSDLMELCYPDRHYRRLVWKFMMSADTSWRDLILTTKDGRALETRWCNVRLSDGSQIGIGLDTSKLWEYEQRIAQGQAEVERRAEQLRALALELTDAEGRERRRIAGLLHDGLQQLLVGARFQAATLGQAALDEKPAEALETLDELLEQAIDATRSLSYELSPPTLQTEGLCGGLEWLARKVYAQHGLEVALSLDRGAEPGHDQTTRFLYQVSRELLFNVVKHAGVNAAEVDLRRVEGQVALTVRDQGAGFEWDKERRAMSGFGLFSIRERVGLLGGTVKVESYPNGGAAVEVRVPAGAAEGCARQPAADAECPVENKPEQAAKAGGGSGPVIRVLLADDHRVMREGLAVLLAGEPDVHVVGHVADGEEAVNQALELKPDVVILDLAMPGCDGPEAARQICAALPEIRIIGLSMFDRADMEARMLDAGAECYLSKMDPPEMLLRTIRGESGG